MQFQQRPPTSFLSQQFRGVINGFLAGLIVGMLIGWFFHGFVGLIVRFGFVLVLLVPLLFVLWYFFLRGSGRGGDQRQGPGGNMQVYTWRSGEGGRRETIDPRAAEPEPRPERRAPASDDVIDSEFRELKRQAGREE